MTEGFALALPPPTRRFVTMSEPSISTAVAGNHFIRTLFMHCLTENAAMMHIARKSGMKIVIDGGGADAHLELAPLDATTIASEFLQERLALFDCSLKAHVLASRRGRGALHG